VARKMIVLREDGARPILAEVPAANEAELQELMKDNPDLVPIDEFDMTGPLLVVGRETSLPSGAVDLVAIARSGELLLIEFKTGPQNTDFRSVLAQLLDYGADLWRMSYDEFESSVVSRYLASDHCQDSRVRRKVSLVEAAHAIWPDLSQEDSLRFKERISQQLAIGSFHYLVVAQRFARPTEQTVEYLNALTQAARFYAVELVRFAADGLSAFESRTVSKPTRRAKDPKPIEYTNEVRFLEGIEEDAYRDALRELLDGCRGLDLRFEWGSVGTSIRLPTPDRPEPLTIAWLFPPGAVGWMSLSDLNLGFDPSSAEKTPSVSDALDKYLEKVALLPAAERVKPQWLRAYRLPPDTTVRSRHQILEIFAQLTGRASG
jgi:hypothetical protein